MKKILKRIKLNFLRWGGGHEDAVQKMSYRNDSNARRQCEWVDLSEMWMEYSHNKD